VAQVIEIENGLVRLVERSVQYSVPMTDWLDKIEKRNPIATPVLPVGTRAVYWDQTDLTAQTFVVLIEQQPQMIRMDFDNMIRELSIPYTRFFFVATTDDPTNTLAWRLTNYKVFWAKAQYADPTVKDMIPALLPNVYEDGRICFGSTGADASQTLANRLNQTCNEFYVSRFNHDLTIRRPNGARTYREWERMTQNNSTGWMDWRDFDPALGYHTFRSYDDLVRQARVTMNDRFAPMLAAEPIPDIPLGASFGRLNEWLETLDSSQRDRLLQAMLADRALNNERYEAPVEPEEDEDA
jgi:Prokaryotic E2 family D